MKIIPFTADQLGEVIAFENELRRQEPDTYFWSIDDAYAGNMKKSFDDVSFEKSSVSFLACEGEKVIGRIDASLIYSRFDGSVNDAYLDWISVLKSERHRGVGQKLIEALKAELKRRNVGRLIALTAENEEAKSFYDALNETEFQLAAVVKIG